jgi:glycosyltransferase involved in cell wall biosynthesis
MKPLVSILIPAYNSQETIADALRSAMAQTWPNLEIIVVDDGSTDETAAVVRRIAGRHIRLIQQPNQGAAAARNAAYAACQGDFIQWLDADDLLSRVKIAGQADAVERSASKRLLASGPWGSFLHRPARAEFRRTALWQDRSPADWLVQKMRNNLHMQTATWLVTRELAELAGPWDTRLTSDDDGEYFCRVMMASVGTIFVNDARVYYRMSGSRSLSYLGWSNRKLDGLALSLRLHVRYLRSLEDSPRARDACAHYLQTWLPYLYGSRPDLVDELHHIARDLGITLQPPVLPWKYEWLRRIFGWRAARQTQLLLPMWKWSLIRAWDKTLFHIERRPDPSVMAGN